MIDLGHQGKVIKTTLFSASLLAIDPENSSLSFLQYFMLLKLRFQLNFRCYYDTRLKIGSYQSIVNYDDSKYILSISGCVTLFFANNYLTEYRITMKFFTHFFLDLDVFFSSHTMFINASIEDFTPIHLVTFSI